MNPIAYAKCVFYILNLGNGVMGSVILVVSSYSFVNCRFHGGIYFLVICIILSIASICFSFLAGCGLMSESSRLMWIVAGIVIVGISLFAISKLTGHEDFDFYSISMLIGSIAFLVAFVAFLGLACESDCLLWTHTGVLVLLIVLQITSIVFFYDFNAEAYVSKALENLWSKEKKLPGSMAQLEDTLKCCGRDGWRDYYQANMTIPMTCYQQDTSRDRENLHKLSCRNEWTQATKLVTKSIRILNWILMPLEVVALLFSLILAQHFKTRHPSVQN